MMDEAQFNELADAALAQLDRALDAAGLDYEAKPGGVIEIEFEDGSKIIVNRHTAAREIWVAARGGGFHFKPRGSAWVGTRDGEEFYAVLSRLASEQSGTSVTIDPDS